jgi:cell division protein FtsN
MPADYKSRVNRKEKKSMPGYLWLLSGLAIGLFVAFIVYLDKQPENDKDFGSAVQEELEKLKHQTKKNTSEDKKVTSTVTNKEKKEPKFNFYTILPELEVLIPESETKPPEVSNGHTHSTSSSTEKVKQYVLQVGSFQNLKDAEKLKANLAFLGLSANIQHVTVNSQSWHRVRTGPYRDKQQLYKNQKLLKQNDINAISMELK